MDGWRVLDSLGKMKNEKFESEALLLGHPVYSKKSAYIKHLLNQTAACVMNKKVQK